MKWIPLVESSSFDLYIICMVTRRICFQRNQHYPVWEFHFLRVFVMNGLGILPNVFFTIFWDDHIIFTFNSINVICYIYWFEYVEPFLHPRHKFHLIMVYIPLMCCWSDYQYFCCCSVPKSCLPLHNPIDCSTSGFPVPHHPPEFAQVLVHCICDVKQPSHPLSPSSSAFNLS